jgi:PKD repeat protein
VYGFIAHFTQQNCDSNSNCPNSLSIQINNYKVVPANSSVNIDSALYIGQYPYLSGALSNSYTVQFQSNYNKTPASYYWNFGDGSFSTLANPVHTYKYGKYNTCLSISGANGCVSNICQKQNLDFLTTNCTTSISDINTAPRTKQFNQTTSGTAPYNYLWSFGDGGTSTTANPLHTYALSGSYPITLRVIDATSDTAFANYNAITQLDSSSCAANYKTTSINQLSNQLALSTIIITWVDAQGNVYTSNNILQPTTSTFEILSVADYMKNEINQTTKKLHVKFSCMVYNGTNVIPIYNAEAIICVAYK